MQLSHSASSQAVFRMLMMGSQSGSSEAGVCVWLHASSRGPWRSGWCLRGLRF